MKLRRYSDSLVFNVPFVLAVVAIFAFLGCVAYLNVSGATKINQVGVVRPMPPAKLVACNQSADDTTLQSHPALATAALRGDGLVSQSGTIAMALSQSLPTSI